VLAQVTKVYLLVRGKRDKSAHKRVEQLLCSSLFNMLHADALNGTRNVFNKVEAVEGDLSHPQLGLSATAMTMLHEEVSMVIHCAANIELDAQIQWTLR
jgi:fatty acyl-CoA reductase